MLLRIFNDDTPLINTTTMKGNDNGRSTPDTPALEIPVESTANAEDVALKEENVELGQDEQEQMDIRETWTKAGDEEDRFNTTV